MSQKKILYYTHEGIKKSEEKIIKLPLKTGSNSRKLTDEEIEEEILNKKYFKAKIFPPEFVIDSIPNVLYFENEKVYEVLKNNKNLNMCCNPKFLIKNIEVLLLDIDCYSTIYSSYKRKISLIESNIYSTIETLREDNNKFWYVFYDNVQNIRNLIKMYSNDKYDNLIDLYYRIGTLRYNCIRPNYNLFQILIEFNKIYEEFYVFDLPLEMEFEDKKKIKFDDSFGKIKIEKIYDYITEEYSNILSEYELTL